MTGDHVVELGAANTAFRAAQGHAARSLLPLAHDMMLLLDDWDRNFAALQGIVEFLGKESLTQPHLASAVHDIGKLDIRPPVPRPSKILNAAANYSGHLAEMRAYTQTGGGVDPAKIYAGTRKPASLTCSSRRPARSRAPTTTSCCPRARISATGRRSLPSSSAGRESA